MPKKRRILSCQSCRRLKTRCEVVPGSVQCVRCATLRLDCSLPSIPASDSDATRIRKFKEDTSRPTGECGCEARLEAIEASLAEIKQLLKSQIANSNTGVLSHTPSEDIANGNDEDTPSDTSESESGSPMYTAEDSSSQVAPIKVVRQLNNLITGRVTATTDDHILGQLYEIGLSSTELTTALYRGFEQVCSGWPFIIRDGKYMKENHPLLFAACLLMGVRTVPGLNGSETHYNLHALTKNCLAVKMLNTPVDLSTIQAMLGFSLWSLAPDLRSRYIDSWFLSGTTISHCMLSFDMAKLCALTDFSSKEAREKMRTWTTAALLHIKFAVGTGRPSVVDPEYLYHWADIATYPGLEAVDRQACFEMKLYILLYNAVFKNSLSLPEVWEGIESWRCRYLDEASEPLKFAYSCVSLIVARWELTKLQEKADTPTPETRTATLISSAIHHSQLLLMQIMTLCATTALVRTSYDSLLCAYAGLTLVEYSASLPDLQAAYSLMENVQMQAMIIKMPSPVFTWATGVMRKRASDQRSLREAETMAVHRLLHELEPSGDWIPSLLVDSVDPSLLSTGERYDST